MLIKSLNRLLKSLDLEIVKKDHALKYGEFLELYRQCQPYTMTSIERMYALYKAVEYVVQNKIPGDFVECGVWKGGSSMLMALTLKKFGDMNRKIWMYDTYEGMSEPGKEDADIHGQSADHLLKGASKEVAESVWCYSSLDEVKKNLSLVQYPMQQIEFVQGKVEDTIPAHSPAGDIALLRLDTDWYESTRHELHHLFPKLIQKGILIIDDYGHWVGARKAVDEYLKTYQIPLFLNSMDYSGRIAVKV